MRIVTLYPNLKNKGGAQNIALLLAEKLNNQTPVVLTRTPLDQIHKDYQKSNMIFVRFNLKNVLRYCGRDTIFLSHHRMLTTLLMLQSIVLFHQKLLVVHVAHNTFESLKFFTLFPRTIIAVSHGVKQNLISYFGIKEDRITVIFNGVKDIGPIELNTCRTDEIKILLAGRLCVVKQQVELVRRTMGVLKGDIGIYFAGEGDTLNLLKESIGSSLQYHVLGQVNLNLVIKDYDYVCLFSQKEGLPVTLIEGTMFGRPLITNDLSAIRDVNIAGYNGFVVSDWSELVMCMNNLPLSSSDEYKRLADNSRRYYEKHFKEEIMIEKYRNLLLNLLVYDR